MNGEIVKNIAFILLLLIAAVSDLQKREIPDIIPIFMLAAGLICINSAVALTGALCTGLPYFVAALAVNRGKSFAIGGGDIKLAFASGFVLGPWNGTVMNFIALTSAMIIGILYARFIHEPVKKVKLPLAPFLCVGGAIASLLSQIH